MTGRTEVERARTSAPKEPSSSRRTSRKTTASTEEREGVAARRSSRSASRHKRDRVAPEGAMLRSKEKSSDRPRRRKSSKTSRKLKIETDVDGEDYTTSTPRTEASTPGSVRSDGGPRSPGQRKSPAKVASADQDASPIPDLITQTDRHGNAVTPRTSGSIENARKEHPSGPKPHLHVGKDGKLHEDDASIGDMEACTETLMDSIRIMCCCFMPDEPPATKATKTFREEEDPEKAPEKPKLLPPIHVDDKGKKCLVLDLDETLVHSSFRAVPGADFVIPVQIEDVVHFVYVLKRPGVDEFLIEMAKHYEIVIYTASLNKYADPLLDLLDPKRVIRTRLFRESCVYYEGNYVKDLSLLDRELSDTIIVDNSPSSYIFHPENAIDCSSYIDDPSDRELDQIAAFLKGAKDVRDVRGNCHKWREWPNIDLEDQ